ncbi:polyadenylate-binding protein 8-like [Olea europaea var. sylvestris]|uniref:Polyadenylate-binding 8-like n=1 Tax=Olea europaea subsp. europaea TaxID=158383 RepID=A0A8S0UTR9_OLEEU|nr:polyadenylate-binding protein 8-like [Olea europaea var. sylvestris]CAA3021473.1 polyadenylate-binding 8-like [Olea europaea subsp. europaea]
MKERNGVGRCRCWHGGGNGVGSSPPSLFDADALVLTWGRRIGALASALANASPTKRRTMLGENLYPLVEQLDPNMTAKVTGKLLKMDQTKALHLLESPDALKAKVAEAMEVLRNMLQQQASNPIEQLADLALN